MAVEQLKVKSLKLKDSGDTERLDLLKSALKRPSTESPDRREKGTSEKKDKENSDRSDKVLSKGKEPLKSGSRDSVRSSIGKNLVKVGKEFAKGNGREHEGKVANKVGSPVVKQEARVSVKAEAKTPVKLSSKDGKVLTKDEGKANGREQGKSVGKELGKVNGKDSGGVRDLMKVKDEDRDREREKEKGKSPVVKSALVRTPVKQGSATKVILKSTNAGASSSLGQSLKKKVIQTKTTTITKTLKKMYSLPGQRHDPPEDRDPLRIFYSTLRDQMPESEMAEIWLMEYGLLPQDEAKKALERKQRRGQSVKHGTPSKAASTPLRLSNGSPAVKKSIPISNGKGKDVGTSSKGKKKREDSESDSDHDLLQKARIKKKLKA
ncbi:hypothetical protein KC19_4G063400 [Ceratodon purpureus]|uniref:Uncharacterized protein n=1 Tax=Ceratodon purpureus TaxID=3225 RepID=A0A8T0I919_CERPU|nr:hypothetical protein KC19_4G063400 [Ceratodon purpureus]